MKHLLVATIILCTGCATGYGTLAGMGAGAIIGGIAAANNHDGGYVGQGIGLGALIGVAAAGVASLVAYHDSESQRMRHDLDELKRERDERESARPRPRVQQPDNGDERPMALQ